MQVLTVDGDLLDQPVEVIVNAWNRNVIPWWLLWPQGVSGAIKKRAGIAPFKELAKMGSIALGEAVLTSAGSLPFEGIIHVAGIDLAWRSSKRSIQNSVLSAMRIVNEQEFESVAFPVIGAGSSGLWGYGHDKALALILKTLEGVKSKAQARIVVYRRW